VSEGGLAVAIVECCVAVDDPRRMIGAQVGLPAGPDDVATTLFGEAPSRVVVSVPASALADVKRLAHDHGVPCFELGTTGGDRIVIGRAGDKIVDVSCTEARDARESCLERIVGA
jgi:phosphoribosylformylglycinamidine (FGAM) synthase-like enzyme